MAIIAIIAGLFLIAASGALLTIAILTKTIGIIMILLIIAIIGVTFIGISLMGIAAVDLIQFHDNTKTHVSDITNLVPGCANSGENVDNRHP